MLYDGRESMIVDCKLWIYWDDECL